MSRMIEYQACQVPNDYDLSTLSIKVDTQQELDDLVIQLKNNKQRISELYITAKMDKLTIDSLDAVFVDIITINKSSLTELVIIGGAYRLRVSQSVINKMNVSAHGKCFIEKSIVNQITGHDKLYLTTENSYVNVSDAYQVVIDISDKHFVSNIMSMPGSEIIENNIYNISCVNCGLQVYITLNISVKAYNCPIAGIHTKGDVEITGSCKSVNTYGRHIKCLPDTTCVLSSYASFRECTHIEINDNVQIAPHAICDFTLSSAEIIGFNSKNITHCLSMIEYIELYTYPSTLNTEESFIKSFITEMIDNPVTNQLVMEKMSYTILLCCIAVHPENKDQYIGAHLKCGGMGSAGVHSNKIFTEMMLHTTEENKLLFIEHYNVASAYFTGNKLTPVDDVCYKTIYESVYPESYYKKFNILHLENTMDLANITELTEFYGGRFNLAMSQIMKNTKFMNRVLGNKSFLNLCLRELSDSVKIEFLEHQILYEAKHNGDVLSLMKTFDKIIADSKMNVYKFSVKLIRIPLFTEFSDETLTKSYQSWISYQPVLTTLLKNRQSFMTHLINVYKRNIPFETIKYILNFCMDNPNDYDPLILKSIFDAIGPSFSETMNSLIILLANRTDIEDVLNLFSSKDRKSLLVSASKCSAVEARKLAELAVSCSALIKLPTVFNNKPLQKLSLKYTDTITYNQLQLFKKTYNKGTTEYNQFNSILSLMKPNDTISVSSLVSSDSKPDGVFPFIDINDFKFEMEPISIGSQSMTTDQYVFRIVIPKHHEFASNAWLNLKEYLDLSTDEKFISNKLVNSIESNHPVSPVYPTLGWVRFSVDQNKKNVWVSEIQTDLTKHIRIMNKKVSNDLYDYISSLLFYTFKLAVREKYTGFNLVVLSAPTRQAVLGGSPSPSVYDNNARTFGLKKHQVKELRVFDRVLTGCIWTENIDAV